MSLEELIEDLDERIEALENSAYEFIMDYNAKEAEPCES